MGKKHRTYRRRAKPRTPEIAERRPTWDIPRKAANLFLRGVSESCVRLAREYGARHGRTIAQVFEEAVLHLRELELEHDKDSEVNRRIFEAIDQMHKETGLPDLPKGTVIKWIREYRDE